MTFLLVTLCCILPVLLFALIYFWSKNLTLKEKLFVWFWSKIKTYKGYHDGLRSGKLVHFGPLQNMQSADPICRSRGELRVLEFGAGPGANFELLPPNTRLTVVEPNRFFQPVFEENLKNYPSVKLDRYIIGKVEDMSAISDGSIDVVISTCVLCSVDNTEETLKEIQRVLVSGGKYFYWEHVHSERETWKGWLVSIAQSIVSYKFLDFSLGGYLDRMSHVIIEKDPGFAHVEQSFFHHNLSGVWLLNSYTVKGVAINK